MQHSEVHAPTLWSKRRHNCRTGTRSNIDWHGQANTLSLKKSIVSHLYENNITTHKECTLTTMPSSAISRSCSKDVIEHKIHHWAGPYTVHGITICIDQRNAPYGVMVLHHMHLSISIHLFSISHARRRHISNTSTHSLVKMEGYNMYHESDGHPQAWILNFIIRKTKRAHYTCLINCDQFHDNKACALGRASNCLKCLFGGACHGGI